MQKRQTVLITGITDQDDTYLAEFLLSQEYTTKRTNIAPRMNLSVNKA